MRNLGCASVKGRGVGRAMFTENILNIFEVILLNYTLTPHGSVASSREFCITWLMVSRSDRISARFFVPRTFLSVVAASRRVEWLHEKYVFPRWRRRRREIRQRLKLAARAGSALLDFSHARVSTIFQRRGEAYSACSLPTYWKVPDSQVTCSVGRPVG